MAPAHSARDRKNPVQVLPNFQPLLLRRDHFQILTFDLCRTVDGLVVFGPVIDQIFAKRGLASIVERRKGAVGRTKVLPKMLNDFLRSAVESEHYFSAIHLQIRDTLGKSLANDIFAT